MHIYNIDRERNPAKDIEVIAHYVFFLVDLLSFFWGCCKYINYIHINYRPQYHITTPILLVFSIYSKVKYGEQYIYINICVS